MTKNTSGQTIAEIIITIAVVLLLITGLVVGSSTMLKSARIAKAKSVSAQLVREGAELARALRDVGWFSFVTYGSAGGTTWCLDKTGTWTLSGGSCSVNIDGIYTRSVTFTWNDPKMTVAVAVTWQDAGQILRTDVASILTQWR